MTRWRWAIAAMGVCFVAAGPAGAASFALSAADRDAAIKLGERSVTTDDFGAEWRVTGDGPGQVLTVMTPFHRLALAARNSAFRSEALRPKDAETAVKADSGVLTLWATLRGPKSDFARFFTPVLTNGRQEIKPMFAQNERTARREDDGTFTARCLYVFPIEGIKAGDRVTLVVKDGESKPVARFTVDLAAMR